MIGRYSIEIKIIIRILRVLKETSSSLPLNRSEKKNGSYNREEEEKDRLITLIG